MTWFVKRMSRGLLIFVLISQQGIAQVSSTLKFQKKGQPVVSLTLGELKNKVKPTQIEVFEFQNSEKKKYEAFPLNALLDSVYGKHWRQSEDILFTCSDGYQPIVPTTEFLQHEALLAFAAPESEDFSVLSKIHQNKLVTLGPFYLIWNNLADPVLKAQGPGYWPYQVTTVDLVRFADKTPRLAPPAKASKAVKEGFALYRKSCLPCHTLNGEGGKTSGVELNRPVSVTKYFKRDWLMKWIADPSQVREGSKMPRYGQEGEFALPESVKKKQIYFIVKYLEAMADHPN